MKNRLSSVPNQQNLLICKSFENPFGSDWIERLKKLEPANVVILYPFLQYLAEIIEQFSTEFLFILKNYLWQNRCFFLLNLTVDNCIVGTPVSIGHREWKMWDQLV